MMKRIVLFLCVAFAAISSFSQSTAEYSAKRLKAADSVYINGKWVKGIKTDTSMANATDSDLPSALGIKQHIQNRVTNLQSLVDGKLNKSDTANMLNGLQRSGHPVTVALQPNITQVGTLSALTVSGHLQVNSATISGTLSATSTGNYSSLSKLNDSTILLHKPSGNPDTLQFAAGSSVTYIEAITGSNGISAITTGGTTALSLGNITPTSVNASGAITGTTLAGTITTAAQPNITTIGTLANLTVSGSVTASSFSGSGANLTGVIKQGGNTLGTHVSIGTNDGYYTLLRAGGSNHVKLQDNGVLESVNDTWSLHPDGTGSLNALVVSGSVTMSGLSITSDTVEFKPLVSNGTDVKRLTHFPSVRKSGDTVFTFRLTPGMIPNYGGWVLVPQETSGIPDSITIEKVGRKVTISGHQYFKYDDDENVLGTPGQSVLIISDASQVWPFPYLPDFLSSPARKAAADFRVSIQVNFYGAIPATIPVGPSVQQFGFEDPIDYWAIQFMMNSALIDEEYYAFNFSITYYTND